MNLPVLPSRMRRPGAAALGLLLLTAGLQPRSAVAQDAVVTYHHHDATGNAVAMTDAAGNVVWRARLRPFGRGSVQLSERPLRYAGQPLESDLTAEGGLYHFGARMFDPLTGRFLSPDPMPLGQIRLDEPQRFNRYAYGLNNPYAYTDTSGKAPESVMLEVQKGILLKHLAGRGGVLGRVARALLELPTTQARAEAIELLAEKAFFEIEHLGRTNPILSRLTARNIERHGLTGRGKGNTVVTFTFVALIFFLERDALAAEGEGLSGVNYPKVIELLAEIAFSPFDPRTTSDPLGLSGQPDPYKSVKDLLKAAASGEAGEAVFNAVNAVSGWLDYGE